MKTSLDQTAPKTRILQDRLKYNTEDSLSFGNQNEQRPWLEERKRDLQRLVRSRKKLRWMCRQQRQQRVQCLLRQRWRHPTHQIHGCLHPCRPHIPVQHPQALKPSNLESTNLTFQLPPSSPRLYPNINPECAPPACNIQTTSQPEIVKPSPKPHPKVTQSTS